AYKHGARFVDVQYFDPYVKRARIAYAADDSLEFVPSWFSQRMLALGTERTTNWTVIPCPSTAWAKLAHPDLPTEEALDRLWHEIAHVCRLDEPDPVA